MKRILIADDDSTHVETVSQALSGVGYEVKTAADGRTAQSLFEAEKFDLLIVDVILPVMTGAELVQLIRMTEKGKTVPVLMTTGLFKSPGEKTHAIERYRISGYLTKPFPTDELLSTVSGLIGGGAKTEKPGTVSGEIAGIINGTTTSKLLTYVHQNRVTGILQLEQGDYYRKIYMMGGFPVYAASNISGEVLGRHLVATGLISHADYERSIETMTRTARRQGDVLIEMGVITSDDLYEALRSHIREKILNAFGWNTGHYILRRTDAEFGNIEVFEYDINDIMLTGIRRFYTADILLPELKRLTSLRLMKADKSDTVISRLSLMPAEKMTLDAVDGKLTLGEILDRRKDRLLSALQSIYALLLLGVLRIHIPDRTGTAKTSSSLPPRSEGHVAAEQARLEQMVRDQTATLRKDFQNQLEQMDQRPAESAKVPVKSKLAASIHSRFVDVMKKNLFDVLGVSASSREVEISAAYQREASKYPPFSLPRDIEPEARQEAEEAFARVQLARDTLLDPERRKQYLAELHALEGRTSPPPAVHANETERWFAKGRDLLEQKRYMAAGEAFQKAFELNTSELESYAFWAWTQYLENRESRPPLLCRQVTDMIDGVLRDQPGSEAANLMRAEIALDNGEPETARIWIQAAMQTNPSSAWARDLLKRIGQLGS